MDPSFKAELDELCQEELHIHLETLLKIVPTLEKIRRLLTSPLDSERFNGLMRMTSKEDPLDCTYVQKCVIAMCKNSKEFHDLLREVGLLQWQLDCDDNV